MASLRESLAPLRVRDYRLAMFGNSASFIGDQIVPVALAFAVLEVTGSATALGVVLLARTVPLAIFVVTGGVWADRLPRQFIMVTTDCVRFVSQAIFAALLFTDHAALWAMALLQAVHGAAGAFHRPAAGGLLPQLLTPDLRQRGNALMYSVQSLGGIVGPAAAGLLLAVSSPAWALALDALSFAVSAFLIARIRTPQRTVAKERKSFLQDLGEGWKEMVSRPWLRTWILNFSLFQFALLAAFFVLGPVVSKTSLGGETTWATISACIGAGSLLGSLLSVRWHPSRPLLAVGGALLLAPTVLFGLAALAPVYVLAGMSILFGAATAFGDTVWETAVQNHVPEHLLSRIVSYDWMGSVVLRPVGLAIVGPLAAVVGTANTLIGAGMLYLLVTLGALAMPISWKLPAQPEPAAPSTLPVAQPS
ncbi:MFS transporter [Micromonospora sp. WMMA1976]|uniref:MFS transporter n=1 Tax=Micromonospora sp. WMMA1976 TaxID=3014995 RepID=UPI00248CC2FE|nr:MFS transporter [Micromonospora sp. WMMA1976]WBC01115.1 MFS transporter [Micromonospora sp. WMMA1976]